MSKPINPDPNSSMTHVVSALVTKRAVLVGQIEHLQSELRQSVADLDNVEVTLRIFDPTMELPNLAFRTVVPPMPDLKGDTSKVVLGALRESHRPLATSELTQAVMSARGMDLKNAAQYRTMFKRVGACLRHWKTERGAIQSIPGPGQQFLWQMAPARAKR